MLDLRHRERKGLAMTLALRGLLVIVPLLVLTACGASSGRVASEARAAGSYPLPLSLSQGSSSAEELSGSRGRPGRDVCRSRRR